MCWQLDPTEGPGRVRRRMMRAPLTIPSRHILPDAQSANRKGEEGGRSRKYICVKLHVYNKIIMYNVNGH